MPSKPKPRQWRVRRTTVEYFNVTAATKREAEGIADPAVAMPDNVERAGMQIDLFAEPMDAVNKRTRAKLGIS